MQIELSEQEIKLLDVALQAWEGEPMRESTMSQVFGAILGRMGGETPDAAGIKSARRTEFAKAEGEMQQRRIKATFVRAKLFQALNRICEHTVDSKPDGGGVVVS